MTQVRIERWHNHYRSATPVPGHLIATWDAAVEDLALDQVLDDLVPDADWVLVREVQLSFRWSPSTTQAGVCDAYRLALREHVGRMLAEGDPAVVWYRDERDALADFLYRAVAEDTARAWAWHQLGWLPVVDRARLSGLDSSIACAAAVIALRDRPLSIWPVLARLAASEAATGALTLMLTRLPEQAWSVLWRACPQTQAFVRAGLDTAAPTAQERERALSASTPPLARSLVQWAENHAARAQASSAALLPWLAAALAPSSPSPASPFEKLLLARSLLSAPPPGFEARLLSAVLAQAPRPRPSDRAASQASPPNARSLARALPERAPSPSERDLTEPLADTNELPPAPELPEAACSEATEWGGLLFLLRLLGPTPLLGEATTADSSELVERLWRLAIAIGVPDDDAGGRAFCGGPRPQGALHGSAGLRDATDSDELVAGALSLLETWLAENVPDAPLPRAAYVAQRPGTLTLEPGWIALSMPAEGVDIRLRRAGLDLDPGWVPWLGCVVRFHYV